MANVVVYELSLTRRTEDITQEFYRTEQNYLQNSNLKNVTSSVQRISSRLIGFVVHSVIWFPV